MKRTVILSSLIFFNVLSCKKEIKSETSNDLIAKEVTVEASEPTKPLDGTFLIDLEKSVVNWRGTMLLNFGEHYGTVAFNQGELKFENGKLVDGTFTVDMNTIANVDGGYNQGLVDHLKNEDFFDVELFPESKLEFKAFEYVDVNRQRIYADMTIKNVTKSINLYNVEFIPSEQKLLTKFKIDRTEFGINYEAKGFAKYKDGAISDAIELEAEIYLKQ